MDKVRGLTVLVRCSRLAKVVSSNLVTYKIAFPKVCLPRVVYFGSSELSCGEFLRTPKCPTDCSAPLPSARWIK